MINLACHLIFRSSIKFVKTDFQNHIIFHCIYFHFKAKFSSGRVEFLFLPIGSFPSEKYHDVWI